MKSDTPGGVRYDDARTRVAASLLADGWHFSLPKLDDWIEQHAERERLTTFRGYLLDAVMAGESRTILPWALLFAELARADGREQAFATRAIKAARLKADRIDALNKVRAIYTDDDRERWQRLHRERYAGHTKRSAARLIATLEGLPEAATETVRKAL